MANHAKIAASSPVMYIKLGEGGKWEKQCTESGIIRFGYTETSEKALCGDWDGVRDYGSARRKNQGAATRDLEQIKDFFEAGEDTIWITFYDRFLWWCRAKPGPKLHPGGEGTYREVIDGWSKTDVAGSPLSFEKLSGKLLKTQAYRGTVCRVPESAYLIRKINCEVSEQLAQAIAAEEHLAVKILPLIEHLHPKDFELLVDLIFSTSGWRRLDPTGETLKLVDIVLELPTTNEKAYVQVKSVAKLEDIHKHVQYLKNSGGFSRLFFVFHSGSVDPSEDYGDNVHFIGGKKLAQMVVNAGLTSWVINKSS
jgi:hypothetical protein